MAERAGDFEVTICEACGGGCRRRKRVVGIQRCPHCRERLPWRQRKSNERSAALLLAATVLYVPANWFPIFYIDLLGQTESDTILQGIVELFGSGMAPVGLVVFFASIMVPLLKIMGLFGLLLALRRGGAGRRLGRTRLYRVIEQVGRWSMIDVFVVSLLISLVQFGALASFRPGQGAACFACVVILTMLAAQSFDPRTIWESEQEEV